MNAQHQVLATDSQLMDQLRQLLAVLEQILPAILRLIKEISEVLNLIAAAGH